MVNGSFSQRVKHYFKSRDGKKTLFFICMMILPLIQFFLFYVCVNFNSIIMSAQHFEKNETGKGYIISFAGLDNFKVALKTLISDMEMLKRTTISFLFHIGIGLTLAIIFSYYIYKQYVGSKVFKVFLFFPQVISSVVFSLIFKYMITDGWMALTKLITGTESEGLLSMSSSTTRFYTILFYTVWMGFGVNVLLFSGAMSGINEAVVESAQLDGVNTVQEFWHITLPMIFPTVTTFIVLQFAGFFTNNMSLFTFFGDGAKDISVVGYFLFTTANYSSLTTKYGSGRLSYSQLSAYGLILTAITIPVVLLVQNLLKKHGPSID